MSKTKDITLQCYYGPVWNQIRCFTEANRGKESVKCVSTKETHCEEGEIEISLKFVGIPREESLENREFNQVFNDFIRNFNRRIAASESDGEFGVNVTPFIKMRSPDSTLAESHFVKALKEGSHENKDLLELIRLGKHASTQPYPPSSFYMAETLKQFFASCVVFDIFVRNFRRYENIIFQNRNIVILAIMHCLEFTGMKIDHHLKVDTSTDSLFMYRDRMSDERYKRFCDIVDKIYANISDVISEWDDKVQYGLMNTETTLNEVLLFNFLFAMNMKLEELFSMTNNKTGSIYSVLSLV